MIQVTKDELMQWINQQPLGERLQIVAQVLTNISRQLPAEAGGKKPLRSLYGLWQGFSITKEDIAQARHEMWGAFAERGF